MRSWRSSVHERTANSSILLTLFHLFVNCFIRVNRMLRQILNVNTKSLMFTNFQSAQRSLRRVDEQVLNLFIVNLDHWEHDFELARFASQFTNSLKDLIAWDGNDTNIRSIANLKYSLSDLPSSKICQRRFDHTQKGNSCILPTRYLELVCQDSRKRNLDLRTSLILWLLHRCYLFWTRRATRMNSQK